jgi:hypothetical protein
MNEWAISTDIPASERRADRFLLSLIFVGIYVGTIFIAQDAGGANSDELSWALILGFVALLLNVVTANYLFQTHVIPRYARLSIQFGMLFSMLFYLIAVLHATY